MPVIDESKWMSGGHLGGQMQTTNWAVVNCTTPANYFHVLRRQVLAGPSDGVNRRGNGIYSNAISEAKVCSGQGFTRHDHL